MAGVGILAWEAGSAAVAAIGTYLCRDGNCTNEAEEGLKAGEKAVQTISNLTGGDPTDELQAGQRAVNSGLSRLQHTFKHAADFGIRGNWSKASGAKFLEAMRAHANGQNTQAIEGTYRGTISCYHYYDPATGLDVMVDLNGNLLAAWRLGADQIQNLFRNGNLQ